MSCELTGRGRSAWLGSTGPPSRRSNASRWLVVPHTHQDRAVIGGTSPGMTRKGRCAADRAHDVERTGP